MTLESYKDVLRGVQPVGLTGRVCGVRGLTIMVSDFPVPIGSSCRIGREGLCVEARVVGFSADCTIVMPLGPMNGICRGDRVLCISTEQTVGVGSSLLGRVINGLGEGLDGKGPLTIDKRMPLWPAPIPAMARRRITSPLSTGVRAIDAMLTVGRGQRMGIFSGSGVGKSVLLGMISRYTAADVTVVALVGERGREVREFIDKHLRSEAMKRCVVVVSTGDEPPLARVQAAATASAVAEYFRDQGANVLLLMDSLTRLASAQRQIGLAAGEPPATKGYTPSVFTLLPELLERCGCTERGSITGFYTVLVEADDMQDPIADAARSVTDGHVWLSRELANRGRYPAIDILQSVSRVRLDVTPPPQQAQAAQLRRILAAYAEIEELLTMGAYQGGSGGEHDLAVKAMPLVRQFLAQEIDESVTYEQAQCAMQDLCRQIHSLSAPTRARAAV